MKFPVTGDRYIIKYVPIDNLFVYQRGNVVYLGYGVVHVEEGSYTKEKTNSGTNLNSFKYRIRENSWHRFTRILTNDLTKGISKKVFEKLYKENNQKLEVEKIVFEGRDGCVTNLSLSVTEHLRFFFHAAEWLIESQDPDRYTINQLHVVFLRNITSRVKFYALAKHRLIKSNCLHF